MPTLTQATLDRRDRVYDLVLAEALDKFQCSIEDLESPSKTRWKVAARMWIVRVMVELGVNERDVSLRLKLAHSSVYRYRRPTKRIWRGEPWKQIAKRIEAQI